MKKISTFMLCAALIMPGMLFAAQESCSENASTNTYPSGGEMFVDAVLIRPLGLVGTVVGSAVYVVSLPFSLLGGNAEEAGKVLVVEPAAYTFSRPLGRNIECP